MFGKKKAKAENIQEETYDPYLLEQIQPSGGITFQDTRYVETGTGYETCIHVYDFPQKLDDFWMSKVCNINNTVVTVDISTDNVMEVQKNINRSMKEQEHRYMEAHNFQEKYDAEQRFKEMKRLYEEISSLGEVIKLLHIRIFVADHSYRRLEEKIKNILAKLESNGFRAAIFLNESKTEWESMYRPYKEQQTEDLFFIYEQIVTFDLSTIKEMKPSVFDAQIFNMISLCWDNCVTNGKLMMERLRKAKGEEGALDPEQVTKFLMIIDESHRWINTKKRHALESITIYLREARKFFGGIMLASQSIRDYVPEGSGAEEIDDLKKIFELTQYKFIFHQEADTLPLLDKVFESTLTQSQRNKIPKLEIGENILCIASDRNLEFKVHLTKEEDRIFEGGV